jgi:hypothetical protein
MDSGVVINPATIALFTTILSPIIGALIYVHKEMMKGEHGKFNEMKDDRNFYRKQCDEKDNTQLEAILALKEGIGAVRGIGQDMNIIKTQINILTDKMEKLTAAVSEK